MDKYKTEEINLKKHRNGYKVCFWCFFYITAKVREIIMQENKRENTRLTIERQLEQFQLKDVHHVERYEILWHS